MENQRRGAQAKRNRGYSIPGSAIRATQVALKLAGIGNERRTRRKMRKKVMPRNNLQSNQKKPKCWGYLGTRTKTPLLWRFQRCLQKWLREKCYSFSLRFTTPLVWRLQCHLYWNVCDQHLPWDQSVPESIRRQWEKFQKNLPDQLQFPRSVAGYQETIEAIDLHMFWDTSGVESAAVVYAVVYQASLQASAEDYWQQNRA